MSKEQPKWEPLNEKQADTVVLLIEYFNEEGIKGNKICDLKYVKETDDRAAYFEWGYTKKRRGWLSKYLSK